MTPNPRLLRHAGRTHSLAPTPQQVSSCAGRGREIPPAAADVIGASLGLPLWALRVPCPRPTLPGSKQPWRVHGSRQIPKCKVGTTSSGYFTWGHLGCLTPRKVGAVSADAEHLEMRTNLMQTSLSNVGKTAIQQSLAEQLPPSQSQGCEWTARSCCRGESWRLPWTR